MSDFPPSGLKEDSAKFASNYEDPAVKSEMEGGYMISRPRHTRPPRMSLTTGFTNIDHTKFLALESFYLSMRGGSQTFTYTHPTKGTDMTVRIKSPMTVKYTGEGATKRYDVDIELEQV